MQVPNVMRMDIARAEEGRILGIQGVSADREVSLPPELAIREIPRLDASDVDALIAFMEIWGPLTSWSNQSSLELLPDFDQDKFGIDPVVTAPRRLGPEETPFIPFQIVSHHVSVLKAVIEHWFAYQSSDDSAIISAWVNDGFEKPSIVGAWDRWTAYLNAGLAPFTVRLDVEGLRAPPHYPWELKPWITAYSAMMLQIYNDVASNTAWRICENEPCGRMFARQEGRAEAGQHRTTGVIYCTKECARAQASRQLRRRRAAERKRGSNG
jgi:hypothetical protein